MHTERGAGDEAAVVYGTLVLTSDGSPLMPAKEMAGMESTPASLPRAHVPRNR